MNYENMSDFEINKEIALIENNNLIFTKNDSVYLNTVDDSLVDYCNNPADAWPIIVENNINLEWFSDDDGIYASATVAIDFMGTSGFLSDHENPLRAAMICFLKMNDAK